MKKKLFFGLSFFVIFSLYAEDRALQTRLFNEGIQRLENQNYLLAENLLSQYLADARKDDENRAEALLGFGVALLRNGKTDLAGDTLMELSSNYEGSSFANEGIYWRGICRYLQGDYLVAETLFTSFLEIEAVPEGLEGFNKNQIQRWDSFVYRGWSLYRSDKKAEAFASLQTGLENGLAVDLNFSLFSLFASLALELGENQYLLDKIQEGSYDLFSPLEQRQKNFYLAEATLSVEGSEAAYPLYLQVVQDDASWNESHVALAWKRIFNIEEERGDLSILNATALKMVSLVSYYSEELKPILLRMAAINLENNRLEDFFVISDNYLKANPYDFRMWVYHLEALGEGAPLPEQQILSIITAPRAEPYGDYLWIRRIHQLAKEEDWRECQKESERMLVLYPDSIFAWEVLYWASFSAMESGLYQEAKKILEENEKLNKEISKLKEARKENPLLHFENPAVKRLSVLKAYLQKTNKEYRGALASFSLLIEPYFLLEEVRERNPKQAREELQEEELQLIYNAALVAFQCEEYEVLRRARKHYLSLSSPKDDNSVLLLNYYYALSFISEKDYLKTMEILLPLEKALLNSGEIQFLHSWSLYYLGWASYREGAYNDSYDYFSRVRSGYPDFSLIVEVQKLLAWASVSAGDFKVGAEEFLKYAEFEKGETRDFALFQAGRSFNLAKEYAKGEEILFVLSTQQQSPYGDDALMELASGALAQEKYKEASDYYLSMQEKYPKSSELEESAFLAAESLYQGGDFAAAIDLYSDYKRAFPSGYNFQAALFRGAVASAKLKDYHGARFLYDSLYKKFPGGPYEAEAIIGLAEMATELEEWNVARTWYQLLQDKYELEAQSVQVASRLNSLFYRAQGKTNEVSALLVSVREGKEVQTRRGRQAVLELSDLYLNLYRTSENIETARGWLKSILNMEKISKADLLEANRLLGDDAFREGRHDEAVSYYLDAATLSADDTEIGTLLYKATQVALEKGANEDALKIYDVLLERVPKSSWAEKILDLPGFKRIYENREVKNEE